MAYVYRADLWCDKCGEKILSQLEADSPELRESDDSEDCPQYEPDSGGESDSPQNCASGDCGGQYLIPASGNDAPRWIQYGSFLENPLTTEGYRSLKSMLDKRGEALNWPTKEWAEFYQFEYHKQEYESSHDWLRKTIGGYSERVHGEDASRLVQMAHDLAGALDGDDIQDMFQSDMDSDDFFKESGWYSPEMES